ncbi:hypothetical protein HMN09_00096600 [Mycena chlorophos]|uniref:J domain-containing protein n=1 Tax=Mycena chlorophos TaxID=658473 RepID=A0A8H6WMU3_MYCCL|nr:hypothetical protein HMN09_00096600 [Mycena chlorophos]
MADTESFYAILGISNTASPDEIRRAYKKGALLNHPDRHPNATDAERRQAEERFRKISNAYEILKDTENRRLYDLHGTWPPPRQDAPPSAGGHHRHHDHFTAPPFAPFFDPFEMFENIFGNYRRPGHFAYPSHFENIFRVHDMMADLEREMFSFHAHPPMFALEPFPTLRIPPPPTLGGGPDRGMRWTSRSTTVRTVNGVTHRVDKRRDRDGNEHVHRTYPDGRELYTINGIEQQQGSPTYIQQPQAAPPPPPLYSAWPPPPMPAQRGFIPPPSYHSSPSVSRSSSHHSHKSSHHHRHATSGKSGPVIPPEPDQNGWPRR